MPNPLPNCFGKIMFGVLGGGITEPKSLWNWFGVIFLCVMVLRVQIYRLQTPFLFESSWYWVITARSGVCPLCCENVCLASRCCTGGRGAGSGRSKNLLEGASRSKFDNAQTVKCKPWTERVAEKGLSRGVSRAAWKGANKRWIWGKKGAQTVNQGRAKLWSANRELGTFSLENSSVSQRKFLWVRRGCQASQRKGLTSGEVWGTSGEVWGTSGESLGNFWGSSGLLLSSTVRELPGKSPKNFRGSSGNFRGSPGTSQKLRGAWPPPSDSPNLYPSIQFTMYAKLNTLARPRSKR